MTYLELINNADYKLSHNQITFGEYNKMIEPLRTEIPKKGEWIVFRCGDTDIFKCSECGMRVINPYKYCPNCGSYNGGEEDEI